MSTLTIAAAHFMAIPVRYAVGRWSNLSTSTLLAFNAADLGLNILFLRIVEYAKKQHDWKIPKRLELPVYLAARVVFFLSAVYVTSRLTKPMPIEAAALTNLASLVSVHVAMRIVK
jgi:hypothetical protein